MTLDQLSFQNKNLSMNASGKWVNISGNQITFLMGILVVVILENRSRIRLWGYY